MNCLPSSTMPLCDMPATGRPSLPRSIDYCAETRNRIRLAVAAYAYEVENDPILSDAEFDRLSALINPLVSTGNPRLDWFFLTEFSPATGLWVHRHPEIEGLRRIYWMTHPQASHSPVRSQAGPTEGLTAPQVLAGSIQNRAALAGWPAATALRGSS